MSAIAVGTADNAIVFAADGVCYDYAKGEVAGLGSKLLLMPELDCIVGWTGLGQFGSLFHMATHMRFADFDALLADAVEVTRGIHDWACRDIAAHGRGIEEETRLNMVLGGWSKARQRFETYRMVSYAKVSLNALDASTSAVLTPWQLRPIPPMWCSGAPAPATCERFGVAFGEGFDMTDMAIRLICANRAESGATTHPDTGETTFHNVGGFVQVAMLDGNGITSWIAHRWPEDVVGEPVDPSRGKPLPLGFAAPT